MILLYNPHVDSIHIGFKSVFTNMHYIIYLYLLQMCVERSVWSSWG